jgi:quinol monooxygenase YgiN
MVHAVTYIDIDPGSVAAGTELLKTYRKSAGALVSHEGCRPNRFVIVESWDDEAEFRDHESAPRTAEFRAGLQAIHNSPYDQRVHHTFASGAQARENSAGMVYVVTHVDVPPPRKDETEVLLTVQAVKSRNDGGNVRYDVFQQNAPRTNHFSVVAVWESEATFRSHQAAPHTRRFREELGPKLGAPYDERLYSLPGGVVS